MTTTRSMIPLAQQFQRRLPEIGRLKLGVTTDRAMKAITEWRFVTDDAHLDALHALAAKYGGTPRPYKHAKSDWTQELLSEAPVIDVRLPVLGEGDAADFCAEEWSGGGLVRRCQGTTDPDACMRWVKGPDGAEQAWGPCECLAAGELTCKPKLRVSFFLPGVEHFGVWRLETSSTNAISEMTGLVDLLRQVQADGILEFKLGLDKRHVVRAGERRNYVVPTIIVPHSPEALASGEARMKGSLGSGSAAAIGAGTAEAADHQPALAAPDPKTGDGNSGQLIDLDDEPIEATIVEPTAAGEFPAGWADTPSTEKAKITKAARKLAEEMGVDVPSDFSKIDADLAVATLAAMAES